MKIHNYIKCNLLYVQSTNTSLFKIHTPQVQISSLARMEFIYLAVTVLIRKKISEERVTIECLQLFIEKNRKFINSGSVIR